MSFFILILGVALWWGGHLFKRIAPDARARMGKGGKGIVAAVLGVSILLMIFGYRGTEFIPVWFPPAWTVHLNNLMMLIAIFLLGAGSSKGRARTWFRHPMLIGFTIWTVAHLLVNGDLAAIVLFGGLGLWSLTSIFVINRATPEWHRPPAGAVGGDVRLVVITLVVFAVIAGIHSIFVWPFPG
ncbi:NnrU family protein [Pontivivens nitratireducens]|uniref:NnrU family protein n=1 Tax=Pontivivens nitratireducens TaxID=2758038 RepID=A0A6G7VPB1_9RHOB|nr:NnrU family protein [Pontibrevibacter nitratireducens]QIK41879.1 NnrU family protein [Pontibrevibacter nitratireducens]